MMGHALLELLMPHLTEQGTHFQGTQLCCLGTHALVLGHHAQQHAVLVWLCVRSQTHSNDNTLQATLASSRADTQQTVTEPGYGPISAVEHALGRLRWHERHLWARCLRAKYRRNGHVGADDQCLRGRLGVGGIRVAWCGGG
eukprot:1143563-Pelagomonas_calceolata.AAC.2